MTRDDRLIGLAVKAFPRRWREVNEVELLQVHDELGGSTSTGDVLDLVSGGVRVRLADRPPAGPWLRWTFANTPLPPRWHGWMHDQLTSRWFAMTNTLPFSLFFAMIFVGPGLVFGPDSLTFPLVNAAVVVVVGLAMTPLKRRRLVKLVNETIGYDITTNDWRTEAARQPNTSAKWVQLTPTSRVALDVYGRPVGMWSLAAGLALILGAARPNGVVVDLWVARFVPDLHAPLTGNQVLMALAAAAAVASVMSVVLRQALERRAAKLSPASVHPLNPGASQRLFWALTAVPGVASVAIGIVGQPPDQACVAIGSALLVLGSLTLTADHVARRSAERVGRPVSMADLLVGERPVWGPPAPHPQDRRS